MNLDYQFIIEVLPDIASYIPVTLKITLIALVLALPTGIAIGMINYKNIRIISALTRLFMSLIRGTPMVLQIYVIYNLTPYLLADILKKAGIDYNIYAIDNINYAYLALALTPMVTIAEAIRAGLMSLDKGQYEAALAVGLNRRQAYLRILFPQIFAIEIPVLCTMIVNLMKSTSLAFMMAVTEITGRAKILGGKSLRYFEAYIVVFLIYIVLIVIVEKLMKILEFHITAYRRGNMQHNRKTGKRIC